MATPPATARSRNGIKYATLCATCNSKIGEYDDALGDLVAQVVNLLTTVASVREEEKVRIRPGAVVRSVLGHFLAAKLEQDAVPFDDSVRRYLDGRPLSPEVQLYFWLYPFHLTVVARDFTFRDQSMWWGADIASVMKFFPVAFMATDGGGSLPFQSLSQYSSMDSTVEIDLPINLELYMPAFWPERPDRMRTVMGGSTFMDAICTIDGRFVPRQIPQIRGADSESSESLSGERE